MTLRLLRSFLSMYFLASNSLDFTAKCAGNSAGVELTNRTNTMRPWLSASQQAAGVNLIEQVTPIPVRNSTA